MDATSSSASISINYSPFLGNNLTHISLPLDDNIFDPGQAYVGISQAQSLADVQMISLNHSSFLVNAEVDNEYSRLDSLLPLKQW
jgi:hypothetical protein